MDQSPPSVPASGQLAPSCSSTLFGSSVASSLRSSYTSSIDDSIPSWWEAQAEHILRGNDLQAILLLCRYRTYRDSSTPASILRTRWTPILNSYLLQLSAGTSSWSHVDDMDLDQKVKEILTRLEPSRPDNRTWWHSTLPAALSQPDASNVASELNEESLSRFASITFLDYVREALYPNEDVLPLEAFKNWHDDLFNQISDRLENFPGETEKFVQVERQLPEGSPVRWAVRKSVLFVQPWDIELVPQPSLEMIYGPLRDLFRHPNANLDGTLKHLAVLEERFQRIYLQEEIDWIRSFDTDTKFFDNVRTMSPRDLAESLTKSDVDAFSLLQPQSFINGDSYLQHLNRQWDERCRAAQDSIIVESRLSHLLADLAKELRNRQNFYSLCAVLQALRETGFDECEIPHLFTLINTDQNYASYRKAYGRAKGLPFLHPHIRQLKTVQEQVASEMLLPGGYENSISGAWPQSLEQPEASLGKKQRSWRTWALHVMDLIPCLVDKHDRDMIEEAPRHA